MISTITDKVNEFSNLQLKFIFLNIFFHTIVYRTLYSIQVYGSAEVPITEETPAGLGITNPYGRTKYMIEEILKVIILSFSFLFFLILQLLF